MTSSIPSDAGFVFVTPSHHCPTMVPLSDERRQDLLARASRNNQIIIEDGYDSQLLDEAPQQALKSIDRSGRVIYVGSMSKTLAPGLRLGYIVALGRPDRRTAGAAPLHAAPSAGQQPARRRAVPVARPSRGAGAPAVVRLRRAAQAAGAGDLGLPAGMALDGFGRRHVALARRPARHRRARALPKRLRRAASSSSPATASSTAPTSRRASCGSASRRSRCSISSRAFANSPPPPDAVPRRPEPSIPSPGKGRRWRPFWHIRRNPLALGADITPIA